MDASSATESQRRSAICIRFFLGRRSKLMIVDELMSQKVGRMTRKGKGSSLPNVPDQPRPQLARGVRKHSS
jgi:hypothetical protein